MNTDYIITTERIGLRIWENKDLEVFHSMCNDPDVMKYFPKMNSSEKSHAFIQNMQNQFKAKGYCYFAAELISTNEFIGFIGLSYQNFEAKFTPCIDIGWRLNKKHWSKGYASEAAKACLAHAFNKLDINEVYSIAPRINKPSILLMKKLKMQFQYEFNHCLIPSESLLNPCVLYKIKRAEFLMDSSSLKFNITTTI